MRRIIQFPLTRIILALLSVIIAIIFRDILMSFFPKSLLPENYTPQVWLGRIQKVDFAPNASSVFYSFIAFITLVSLTLLMYNFYVKKIEKKRIDGISQKKILA